ncbi:glycosyltransferase [Alteromonas oceanisediminis]|uniref:glycosyltransferase n=1 Tax=Alteromonas oceanisediminis TaxID=2836180 RepID=UPI001BD96997|nr:glycosyltransferase [Alteromonas oceanisediminis]MBT0584932.1 glycosyltransferase [Alteromonas oceanisediminis]
MNAADRVIVFGTGSLYADFIELIRCQYRVVALVESMPRRQELDGYSVHTPESILSFDFDFILILSSYTAEIRKRLTSLSVPNDKIRTLDELNDVIDIAKNIVSQAVITSNLQMVKGDFLPNEALSVRMVINSLGKGGAEKSLITLLSSLATQPVSVSLMSIFSANEYRQFIPENVTVLSLSDYVENQNVLRLALRHATPSQINHWFGNRTFDVDIAYIEGWATKIVASSASKKKIAWCHTNLAENHWTLNYCFWDSTEEKSAYSQMDALVFVSYDSLAGFKSLYELSNQACHTIPNLICTPTVNQSIKKDETFFTFASVGRLNVIKGYDRLISAFSRLIQSGVSARLIIWGEGEERANLEAQIRREGIEQYSALPGFVPSPFDGREPIDCFVSSSLTEGHPLAIGEALLAQIPVIATTNGGSQEILEDGRTGMLVSSSVEGLFNGMYKMATSPNEQMKWKVASSKSRLLDDNKVTLQKVIRLIGLKS